ncbi:zinc-binding oxidoreductase, partial [Lojkania enalia]
MKAWVHTRVGLPSDVLSLSTIPTPSISSPNQVLIRISHCALNPGASITMQLLPFYFRKSPAIPEMDFSGTVVQCGSQVLADRALKPGTYVFGSIPVSQHVRLTCGALAEYVVVEHTSVVRKPSDAKLEEVAGLGIAGATALDLIKAAKLKKGDSVLVNGASGGIGHFAVQMCREAVGETGKVVAICSSNNVPWVKLLGCNEVIDYAQNSPVHKYLAKEYSATRFDVVIDAVGVQEIFNNCPAFLAEKKPYVSVGPRPNNYTVLSMLTILGSMAKNFLWPKLFGGVPRPYMQAASVSDYTTLLELGKLVEERKLKAVVGMLVKMEDAQKAYQQLLSGHTKGKVVVQVQQ